MSQLIGDILDLSRIEADKIELRTQPVELRALLRDLELMFGHSAKAKGLVLQWVVEEGVPPVLLIDAIRLRQILVNLIGNAVKFTEAGQVQVRVVGREEGGTCHLHIAVTDTGPGIPLEQQEEIFNLFTQRRGQDPARYGGAGLGLSICRRMRRSVIWSMPFKPYCVASALSVPWWLIVRLCVQCAVLIWTSGF